MLTTMAKGRTFDYSHNVGRSSQSGMGFYFPTRSTTGDGDVVYVVSRGGENLSGVAWDKTGYGARVSKLSIGTESGDEEFLGEFGGYGTGDGEFIWPSGIARDKHGNLFVTDEWLNRVSIFDPDGKFLSAWSTLEDGVEGPNGASDIAISADQIVYITDSRSHEVKVFEIDGSFLNKWGGHGISQGQFDGPWGVTIDGEGSVYVVDHLNHRVQKFSHEGDWILEFGGFGTEDHRLFYPCGIAVDPEGDIYVSDWTHNGWHEGKVKIFGPDGEHIAVLIGDAVELSKWGQMTVDANVDVLKARRRVRTTEPEWRFSMPTGITFDEDKNRIIIADQQRGRVQIYNKLNSFVDCQLNL